MDDGDIPDFKRGTPTGTSNSESSSGCSDDDSSDETYRKDVYDDHSASYSMTVRTPDPINTDACNMGIGLSLNSYPGTMDGGPATDGSNFMVSEESPYFSEERPSSWHGDTNREGRSCPRPINSLGKMPAVPDIPQSTDPLRTAHLLQQLCRINNSVTAKPFARGPQKMNEILRQSSFGYRHISPATPLVENTFSSSSLLSCNRIFLTYSVDQDSNGFIGEMQELVHTLRLHRFHVDFDMDHTSFALYRRNRDQWIDNSYKKADWILVCVTPAYPEDVEEPQNVCARARTSQLNARYIYDKIRLEYRNNQCQNFRVIPVIFTNSGTSMLHVPSCMQTTYVYKYPGDIGTILDVLRQNGNYIPD